jgi:hypothetical protein
MHPILLLQPSTDAAALAVFLEEAELHGHTVQFPGSDSDPGTIQTVDPALMLGAMPEKIRNYLRSGEWTARMRFHEEGDLDLSPDLISVCAELGVGISVRRSIPESG